MSGCAKEGLLFLLRFNDGSMKNVILFHGYNGKARCDWMLWLEKELEKQGVSVTFLSYEDSQRPVMEDWLAVFDSIHEDITDETVFVCHSFGSLVAMKFLERTGLSVSKMILVACPKNDLSGETLSGLLARVSEEERMLLTHFAEQSFDWEKVKACVSDVMFLYSEDDPAVPYEETLAYYQPLFPEAMFTSFKNHGHFNTKSGVVELPDVLEMIA